MVDGGFQHTLRHGQSYSIPGVLVPAEHYTPVFIIMPRSIDDAKSSSGVRFTACVAPGKFGSTFPL